MLSLICKTFVLKYKHFFFTELGAEGTFASDTEEVPVIKHITFYRARTHRFWRRQANEITKRVQRFSEPELTQASGAHGEQMFDAALPRFGFMPTGTKVRSYGGKTWTETGHDLDRVFERDGIAYGTEIKNTLKYIPRDELTAKLKMCKFLRPLFIVRYAPKSYNFEVFEQGGFTLVIKYQLYPFGRETFADDVKASLRLPVDSPARIEHGTIERLLSAYWLPRVSATCSKSYVRIDPSSTTTLPNMPNHWCRGATRTRSGNGCFSMGKSGPDWTRGALASCYGRSRKKARWKFSLFVYYTRMPTLRMNWAFGN